MSDIITRLVLKSDSFEKNLEKAKSSVGGFEKGITDIAGKAGAGVMKFAGAIGIAVSAGEGFMSVIRGSQTTSDKFDSMMRICKTSVDEFFTSLSTGDFTTFLGGLSEIVQKAAEVNAALDQLGNTRISYDYFSASFNADAAKARMNALDKENSRETRVAAFQEWENALSSKRKYASSLSETTLEALKKVLVEGTRLDADSITLKDFEEVLAYDVTAPSERNSIKERMSKMYDTYKVKYEELESRKKSGGVGDWAFPDSKDAKERQKHNDFILQKQEELNEQFKAAILFNQALVKWSDEQLINAKDLAKEHRQINRELDTEMTTYNRSKERFDREKTGGGTGTGGDKQTRSLSPQEIPEGSFAYLDKLIADKRKELQIAISDESRLEIQKELDILVEKKRWMEIEVKYRKFDEKNTLDEQLHKGIKGMAKLPKLPKKLTPFDKKDIKDNKDYADSLYSIGNAFGALGTMASQFGEDGLAFVFNSMGSIAQMITQLESLTIAKGVASAADLPFPASLAAMATVISTVGSIFAGMAKFDEGGIIGGSAFFGDQLVARVNSGEMILNQRQQSNLFNAINSGSLGGNSHLTLGFDKVRVDGKYLELAINNSRKKQGKKPL